MIELIELTTGQLMIVLKDKEDLQKLYEDSIYESGILPEMLESSRYIGNDWYVNQTIGLTESPNICKGAKYFNCLPNEYFESYIHYIEQLIDEDADYVPKSYKQFVEEDCNVNTDLPIDFEKVWYYPYYMTKSFVEELLDNGFVIFEKAQ